MVTKGERREEKRRKKFKMRMTGRGVRDLQNIIVKKSKSRSSNG